MARTMFVNPALYSNPGKKRRSKGKKASRKGRKKARKGTRYGVRAGRLTLVRRNAGIAPFVQANPLILSNPVKRRRRRRSNPMGLPTLKGAVDFGLSTGGGAIAALTLNTVGLSKIKHTWGRRASQAGAAIVGGAIASRQSQALGGAFAGAMLVPLLQDIAATYLGIGVGAGVVAKEADLDALAADLEDVLDDMDDSDFDIGDDGDDDEERAW